MRRNALVIAILLTLLSAMHLTAQTPRSIPFYVQWEDVPGAGGFTVEVRDTSETIVLTKQVTPKVHDILLDLPVGNYEFRIITLNKFLRFENATEWVSFEVLAYKAPEFIAITPESIVTDKPLSLTLRARYVTENMVATLVAPDGTRNRLLVRRGRNGNYTLTGKAQTQRGSYSLELLNPPNLVTKKKDAIAIIYQEPVVASVSPSSLVAGVSPDGAQIPIEIAGTGFSAEVALQLVPSGDSRSGTEPETETALYLQSVTKERLVALVPADLKPGSYMLRISNAQDLPSKDASPFTVSEPPATPQETPQEEPTLADEGANEGKEASVDERTTNRIAIGVGGNLDYLGKNWNEVYDPLSFAALIFADYYFTDNLRPASGFTLDWSGGIRANFWQRTNDGSGKYMWSELGSASFMLSPACTISFPRARIRTWVGGGLNYLVINTETLVGDAITEKSLDAILGIGTVVEYPIGKFFSVGAGGQFSHTFNSEPLNEFLATICTSVIFPVRR